MERSLVRFAGLLRAAGVRVSTGEVVDGMCAAAAVELRDRQTVKTALGVALVKDSADWPLYEDLFDRFFALDPTPPRPQGHQHEHGHDDLRDELAAERVTLSEEPAASPQLGHDHGKPADIREYFDSRDLASSYNLHQDAQKIDMASITDQVAFARDQPGQARTDGWRVQLSTDRLQNAWSAGELAPTAANRVEVDLSIAGQSLTGDGGTDPAEAAWRARAEALAAELPELLRSHLATLAAQQRQLEHAHAQQPAFLERVSERDRVRMEEAIRRLARQLHGALTARTAVARSGRVDVGRTMRRNLRHDGIPFAPVTVARRQDRPRLVILADVSLSVRSTARFTLHLVHGLQRLFPRVRTFAFVDDIAETTELFSDQPLEAALGTIFGGGLLDVDGNSDYGRAFTRFAEEHLSAVTSRTSVVVLGDGRGNGRDPGLEAFDAITDRARRTVWLTPEPGYSWRLGRCDLPRYAPRCSAVHVVRDIAGLDSAATQVSAALRARSGVGP